MARHSSVFMPVLEHRLLSFDATPLFYRIVRSEGPLRGRVLIVHGMGEHGGRYLEVAAHLAAQGFESVIPDLRGFGKSGGPRAYVDRFSDFHSDLEALRSFIQRSRAETPIFYLGHSLGGLLVSSYISMRRIESKGLILSSPLFGIAARVPSWKKALGLAAAEFAPHFSQSTGVRPELLTHDPRVVSLYRQDPLIYQRLSARLYRELSKLMAQAPSIARTLGCPTLVLQAAEDHIVDKEKTIFFYKALVCQDKILHVYPKLYHEILNETERQSVYLTISEWLQSKFNL